MLYVYFHTQILFKWSLIENLDTMKYVRVYLKGIGFSEITIRFSILFLFFPGNAISLVINTNEPYFLNITKHKIVKCGLTIVLVS